MSATKNSNAESDIQLKKNILGRLAGFFGSVKLAVSVLSFIACTSVLGTIIKQNGSEEDYLSLYSETTLKIIDFFGLSDVYHAPWFVAAIILFAINLVVCTSTRFFRKWKKPGHVRLPDEKTLYSMGLSFTVKKNREDAISLISKRFGRKIYEGEDGLILEKGLYSRYGVFCIHISILIVLIGSLIGIIWGYRGFVVLQRGDVKDRFVLRGRQPREVPLGFAIRCRDFNISLYPNGSPRDYVTSLEVIEKQGVLFKKDVRVNSPLSHRGIQIYQASYGLLPSFSFKIDGRDVKLKEQDEYEEDGFIMVVTRFEKTIHNFGPGVQVAFLEDGKPKTTWFLRDIPEMKQRDLGNKRVVLEDIKEDLWTGLEVSYDPGIIFVWTGFALMFIGLYIHFFVVSGRVYIRKLSDCIIVAGIGTRQMDRFKSAFERIKRRLNGAYPS